jgi:hypothetical protein
VTFIEGEELHVCLCILFYSFVLENVGVEMIVACKSSLVLWELLCGGVNEHGCWEYIGRVLTWHRKVEQLYDTSSNDARSRVGG